jgi:L-alanine-DL-glutamate epimerase-like enolase superfamily enzyme
MKKFTITHFTVSPLKVPLVKPLRQSNGTINDLMILVLTLHTKDGITGQSFIYGIGKYGHTALIPYIENELLPQIIGQEFKSPEDVWKSLWLPRRDKLKGGLCLYALALIDIACWDITAIANQKSLHHLLGGNSKAVPVYGSGGWLSMSLDELHAECNQFMQKGISTYKIKVGGNDDEKRIAFLRREFGYKINLAVDANQLLSLNEGIDLGRMLKNYDITWLEDPLFSDSIYELKKLSEKTEVPICVGENFHSQWQFEDVCEGVIAEVLQADVVRCGGITKNY